MLVAVTHVARVDEGSEGGARRWGRYLAPALLIAATLGVAGAALVEAVEWLDRPFPGFFAYSSGLVSPMQRSEWQGRAAGIRPGDRVLAIDGIPFADRARVSAHLRQRAPGDPVRVDLLRRGERQTLALTLAEFSASDVLITLATPFSIGIFYLLMGTVIFFLKPRARPARLTLVLLSLIALFYLTTFDANTSGTLERLWIGYPLFGAVAVHLFTCFPEEWRFAARHPWIRVLPYGVAGVLVLLRQIYLGEAEGSTALAYASTAFVSAVTVTNFFLLLLLWRQTESQITIRKVKVILVGLLATSTLAVVWSYAARFDPDATTWDMAMLLSAPFPILMTYAIVKHNIFDVDEVLRATSSYVLSSGLVIGLYFGVVAFFTLVTQEYLPFYEATPAAVIATLAVAVAFHPLRVGVQRLLNRFFFREKYDLGTAVAEMTQELSKVTDVSSLARVLAARFQRLLRVESVVLLVRDEGTGDLVFAGAAGELDPEARRVRFSADGPFASLLTEKPRARLVSTLLDADRIAADDAVRLSALGARLAVPLLARNTLLGILIIGEKRFEDLFTRMDVQLLETLQTPIAIALENAVLYTERAAKERLAALGQVSSLIIHEVKNPLGIIKVSIGTIKRKLEDDASRELATFIEEEVDRMNRTIAKVLTFARPQEIHAEPCDLNEVVRKTLGLVEPDLHGAGIELFADLDRSAPPLQADAEQMQQVLLNLVLNAKAALNGGGRIAVRTRRGRDWQVRFGLGRPYVEISVEDNGVGMDAETQAKIFTPFFTTRRGGTGLGLAIVKQIVLAHRGEIRVESAPGKGSKFTILLPA
jgi:signal transduction histidine kinase